MDLLQPVIDSTSYDFIFYITDAFDLSDIDFINFIICNYADHLFNLVNTYIFHVLHRVYNKYKFNMHNCSFYFLINIFHTKLRNFNVY